MPEQNLQKLSEEITKGMSEIASGKYVVWSVDQFLSDCNMQLEKPLTNQLQATKAVYICNSAYSFWKEVILGFHEDDLILAIGLIWQLNSKLLKIKDKQKGGGLSALLAFFDSKKNLKKKFDLDTFGFDCFEVFYQNHLQKIDVVYMYDNVNDNIDADPSLGPYLLKNKGVIKVPSKIIDSVLSGKF